MTSRGVITKGGKSTRKAQLDMTELVEWANVLYQQPARVERAAGGLERKYARSIAGEARRAAPTSTGRRSRTSARYGPLRTQIRASETPRRSSAGIGTAFYGLFLERGTRRGITPRPFFGPAIRRARRPFAEDARQAILKILRRT